MEEKKSFWSKVADLYARFGNPSGGMVHSDMPADKAEKAPEAKAEPKKEKAEPKKSLWKEAGELYAAFGNPSGGMTHRDVPAEKKAEPNKAVQAAIANRMRSR